MELNEIWQKEEDAQTEGSKAPPSQLSAFRAGFHNGCLFEYNRPKWFDPEKELPPRSENGRSSEPVLCKIAGGHIKVYRYDYAKNEWRSLGDKVISWAYIPK